MFNGINRFIEKRDIVTFRINVKTLKNIISVADGFESKKQGNLDSTIKDELFFLLILLCLKFSLGWLFIKRVRKRYIFKLNIIEKNWMFKALSSQILLLLLKENFCI